MFKVFVGTLIFSVLGSGLSRALHMDPGPFGPLCSAILVLSGSLIVLTQIQGPWRYLLLLYGAVAEIIGMTTGLIFGRYHYTEAWAPTVRLSPSMNFPLLVPFAWVFVVGGCYLAVRQKASVAASAVIAGIMAACLDAPMERAMTETFHYWVWEHPGSPFGAPLQNAVGWFCIATSAAALISKSLTTRTSTWVEGPRALGLFGLFISYRGWLDHFDLAWPALALVSLIPICLSFGPTIQS